MTIYIRSIAAVSPFTHPAESPFANALVCGDPDLSGFVDPKLTRRMSHVIKMGIGAAMQAIKDAGGVQPGAIVTGTAYGCLDDTGVFLKKQVLQKETMLTPTAFIQSTHNTVGGQIGLLVKSNAYNNTFVHRGFSFEHALEDAMMLLQEEQATWVLAGGADELTKTSHTLLSRFGLYKRIPEADGGQLPAKGTIAGEGAAFFILSGQAHPGNYGILQALTTLFKPQVEEIPDMINEFLAANSLDAGQIDVIIAGRNGDEESDKIYETVCDSCFPGTPVVTFKDQCGEYPTATGFALWKAAAILRKKELPAEADATSGVRNILIYNHYLNIHHSLYLVTAC